MPTLIDALSGALPRPGSRPWPRCVVDGDLWRGLGESTRRWSLDACRTVGRCRRGPYGVGRRDRGANSPSPVSSATGEGFPRSPPHHAPATRLERAIQDLFGYEPVGAPDPRPWLDHGRWPVVAPLGARTPALAAARPTLSSPPRVRGCIRSRSAPCMPALSSRGIFVFTPAVRRSSASRRGWDMFTKASRR